MGPGSPCEVKRQAEKMKTPKILPDAQEENQEKADVKEVTQELKMINSV